MYNLCLLLLLLSLGGSDGRTGISWYLNTVPDINSFKCIKTYDPMNSNATVNHTFMIVEGFAAGSGQPCETCCGPMNTTLVNGTIQKAKQVGFERFDVYMNPSPKCSKPANRQVEELGKLVTYMSIQGLKSINNYYAHIILKLKTKLGMWRLS